MRGRSYPSDISEEEWDILEPLIPPEKPGGKPQTTDMREVINMIWYEFQPWSTGWSSFRIWRNTGVWEQMDTCLRERLRSRLRREPIPSTVIIDSQSVKISFAARYLVHTRAKKSRLNIT